MTKTDQLENEVQELELKCRTFIKIVATSFTLNIILIAMCVFLCYKLFTPLSPVGQDKYPYAKFDTLHSQIPLHNGFKTLD